MKRVQVVIQLIDEESLAPLKDLASCDFGNISKACVDDMLIYVRGEIERAIQEELD